MSVFVRGSVGRGVGGRRGLRERTRPRHEPRPRLNVYVLKRFRSLWEQRGRGGATNGGTRHSKSVLTFS